MRKPGQNDRVSSRHRASPQADQPCTRCSPSPLRNDFCALCGTGTEQPALSTHGDELEAIDEGLDEPRILAAFEFHHLAEEVRASSVLLALIAFAGVALLLAMEHLCQTAAVRLAAALLLAAGRRRSAAAGSGGSTAARGGRRGSAAARGRRTGRSRSARCRSSASRFRSRTFERRTHYLRITLVIGVRRHDPKFIGSVGELDPVRLQGVRAREEKGKNHRSRHPAHDLQTSVHWWQRHSRFSTGRVNCKDLAEAPAPRVKSSGEFDPGGGRMPVFRPFRLRRQVFRRFHGLMFTEGLCRTERHPESRREHWL